MKNLLLILTLLFSNIANSQSLSGIIDFESFDHRRFDKQILFEINSQRYLDEYNQLIGDTVSMFIAKYHTDYFLKYGEETEIHDKPLEHYIHTHPYPLVSTLNTPLNRFFTLNQYLKSWGVERDIDVHSFITEKSFFYDLKVGVTWEEILSLILSDLGKSAESSKIFKGNINEKKHLGCSTAFRFIDSTKVRFMFTYTLSQDY